MSKVTELATAQLTPSPHNPLTIELIEADDMPAVVIVSWPQQPTVLHPQRFPETAAMIARLFATAITELASIKYKRRL
jgi:hypothetical protein